MDMLPEAKVECVAHEFGHIHDAYLERYVEKTIKPKMSTKEWDVWESVWIDLIEDRVEEFARLTAGNLPDWEFD